MKIFVNLVQVLLIMGIIYPVYAVWENDQVSSFCVEVKPNMTKQRFLDLAEQKKIKVEIDNTDELKWISTIKVPTMFSNDFCIVTGLGDRVASTQVVTK